jgi:hypothetical protein
MQAYCLGMISLLGCEIGRGHPFYMDGLRGALKSAGRDDLIDRDSDVFREARGLSRLAWEGVRHSYRLAGHGGVVSADSPYKRVINVR